MTDKRREVEELREEIAKVDTQILIALEKRAKLSKRIGDAMKASGTPRIWPEKAQVVEAVLAHAAAGSEWPIEALRGIFRAIAASCFSLEAPVAVAYIGANGGFAHAAARSRFGVAATYTACETIAAALDEVTRERANYAVVPYETRTDGLMQATIAALTESDLKIAACFEANINLQLVSAATELSTVTTVYATAADRAHCQRFLASELPAASLIEVATPALACERAASEPTAAALAHESTAALFAGLEVRKRSVRDEGDERVRYATIGTRPSGRSGGDLTAIVFALGDSPGALHDVLRQFAERGVSMTKIQSRPTSTESWSYVFFIEVRGHATDRPIVGALEEVRRHAKFFKVLGSYTMTA